MYDTIWVKCPKCNKESGFQSKSGDCILRDYTLKDCPDDVIVDINRHSPVTCNCGAMFEVNTIKKKAVLIN